MFHLLLGLQGILIAIVMLVIELIIIVVVITSLVVGPILLVKGIRLLKNTERKKAGGRFLGFGAALSMFGLGCVVKIIIYVVIAMDIVPGMLNP